MRWFTLALLATIGAVVACDDESNISNVDGTSLADSGNRDDGSSSNISNGDADSNSTANDGLSGADGISGTVDDL